MPKHARPTSYTGRQSSQAITGDTRFANTSESAAGTNEQLAISPKTLATALPTMTTVTTTGDITSGGDIILSSVATQLQMNGGAVTDFIGQATLVSGTVTIANTNIAAADRIFLSRADENSSTALGMLTVTAQTASTSWVITSLTPADGSTTVTGDVSIVNYFIVRQT